MDEDLSWIFSNELSDNEIYVYTLDIPQEIEQEEALNIVEVLDVQDLEGWEDTSMLEPDSAHGAPAQTTLPPFPPLLTEPEPAIIGATGKNPNLQIN